MISIKRVYAFMSMSSALLLHYPAVHLGIPAETEAEA